jgi:hypothetical protein
LSAIRPIAIAVIRHEDRLLVFEGRDTVKGETRARHELMLVFEAELVDDPRFAAERVEGAVENGVPIAVEWKALAAFAEGKARLVPPELLGMLRP